MHNRNVNAEVMCLCLIIGCWLAGCGYPEVSPKAYEMSKALYSACNRQSDEQLSRVVELIESTSRAGEISKREAKWLTAIVEQARSGEWKQAMLQARRLMEDQSTR